jgi:hypothetical protein
VNRSLLPLAKKAGMDFSAYRFMFENYSSYTGEKDNLIDQTIVRID